MTKASDCLSGLSLSRDIAIIGGDRWQSVAQHLPPIHAVRFG